MDVDGSAERITLLGQAIQKMGLMSASSLKRAENGSLKLDRGSGKELGVLAASTRITDCHVCNWL